MATARNIRKRVCGGDDENSHLAHATLRHVRISPRKARLVLNLIKGRQVDPALRVLQFCPQKGAKIIAKLLRSALSNAKDKPGVDVDKLWITGAWADMGRTLQRWMPRAQGRATPIRKRSSHITVILGEK